MTRRVISLAAAIAFGLVLAGCSTSPSTNATALVITGAAPAVGASAQFTATATLSDGTTQNVTTATLPAPATNWQSSNPAVATVSSAGVVTGVADGTVTISVTYQATTAIDTITIAG